MTRNEALRPPAERHSTESRVPLVLTYNQFNTGTKRILLDNFEMLLSDPATRTIYPELTLYASALSQLGFSCGVYQLVTMGFFTLMKGSARNVWTCFMFIDTLKSFPLTFYYFIMSRFVFNFSIFEKFTRACLFQIALEIM